MAHIATSSDQIQLKDAGLPAIRMPMPSRFIGTTFQVGHAAYFADEAKANGLQSHNYVYRETYEGFLMFTSIEQ